MQEGDLDSAIKKYKGYLPEDDIMLKFVQIALALHYTHSKVRLIDALSGRPNVVYSTCRVLAITPEQDMLKTSSKPTRTCLQHFSCVHDTHPVPPSSFHKLCLPSPFG